MPAPAAVALVEKALEQEAGVPISQMTPVQVVEAMISASSAPFHAPGRGGVAAAPVLTGLASSMSSDPILQNLQVREVATREIQRLQALLNAPAHLNVGLLLKGAMGQG